MNNSESHAWPFIIIRLHDVHMKSVQLLSVVRRNCECEVIVEKYVVHRVYLWYNVTKMVIEINQNCAVCIYI